MQQATIVVGLGFGDEGKGSVVDALVRRQNTDLVVRFNGGAQASHAVVTPDGRSHCFHQFGSGTFVPGCRTFLSKYMLVNPVLLYWEEQDLRRQGITDAFERMSISTRALVTTPYHVALNRLRESLRGDDPHGTCGLGIGETMADYLGLSSPSSIRVGDLVDPKELRGLLTDHRAFKKHQWHALIGTQTLPSDLETQAAILYDDREFEAILEVFHEMAGKVKLEEKHLPCLSEYTIFEGAQGVLLDEYYGFPPHHTWSRTTPANARTLLERAGFSGKIEVLGVLRSYLTRHGTGPFPTADTELTASLEEPHNPTNIWQGGFRAGWLDLPLARYATKVAGIDSLAVTCCDQVKVGWKVNRSYCSQGRLWKELPVYQPPTQLGPVSTGHQLAGATPASLLTWDETPELLPRCLAHQLVTPLKLTSWGPTADDKRWEHE